MIKLATKFFSSALIGLVALTAVTATAWARSTGDYRSKQSGNWIAVSTWEVDSSGYWVLATSTPTSSDGVITILNSHAVTVNLDVTIDQTVIEAGGLITITSGKTLTIADGTGTDLTVNGTVLNQGTVAVGSGSPTWSLNSGGLFIQNTTTAISAVLDAANISGGSTFEYRDSGDPLVDRKTYGTLKLSTAISTTYTSSGTNPLTVMDDLLIEGGVTWNTGGFSGDITVQGSTTIDGTWTGSGAGNLGNHDFWWMFTVNGTYNLATTGTTQGQITFEGDLVVDGTFATPSNRNVVFNSEGSQMISGASTAVFNNGFTAWRPLTVESGTTVQVAASETLYVYNDLTVNGTLSGGNALSSVVALKGSWSNFTLPNSPPVATISQVKVKADVGLWNVLYFSGIGNFQSGASFDIDNSSTLKLSGSATVNGGTLNVKNSGRVDVFGWTLTLNGIALNLSSGGMTEDTEGGGNMVTQGSTTIDQAGTFSAPLEVSGGTTTASGTNSFDGNITVDEGATLTIPSGKFLRATCSVTINSGAFVNGSGKLYYLAPYQSFTNAGTISAPAVFEGIGYLYALLDGDGTWTSLTMNDSLTVYLADNTTLTNSNVTLKGTLSTQGYTLSLNGGGLVIESTGTLNGSGLTVETQGTFTITQNGTFEETLHVLGGTTTAQGTFSGDITVDDGAILSISAGDTLTAKQNVTVNRGTTGGTIAGPGRLLHTGYGKTFSNDGLVSAPTTFVNNDGDVKHMTAVGAGLWKSLTIAAGCSTSVSGGHTFTGAGTPFVVNGSVYFDPTSTIVYGGSSAQTVAPLSYYNLEINNSSSDVALGGPVTVDWALTIFSRNLTTGADTLTLGSIATITETAPYSVLGNLTTARVCSTGLNQTFGGMGVEINAAGAWPGPTTVTRITGTAPTFSPGIPVKRYFDIAPATNTGLNATFVYRYLDNELNGNTESGIQLYKSTNGGSTWTLQGGSVNTGSNTITLTGVDGFSRWIAGGTGNPAPTVSSISPSTAALGATLDVILTGTVFTSGISTPSFGLGITVNSFTVNSPTQITANITVSLSAAIGARNVTVTNSPPGGGDGILENAFTLVNPVPTLTSVEPAAADRGTDVTVVLHGSNFLSGVSTVGFGPGIIVRSTTVESSTQIRVDFKIGVGAATGPRDVTVTNSSPGGGTATLPSGFMVGNPAPAISDMSPSSGSRGQTMAVTFNGTGFLVGVTSVTFGPGITVNSVAVSSSIQMKANITIALDAPTGASDVSVTNPEPGGGTVRLTGAFAVVNPAPTLATMSPASGNRGQTLSVTVTGTNFIPGVTTPAYGGGITVNSVSSFTSTQVTASVTIDIGATPGPRDITVTNAAPGGGTATLSGAFTVNNPSPSLSSVSPTRAGRGSSINAVLTGTNFLEGVSSVSFGPDVTVNSTTITGATQITVNISIALSAATGARNVSVTNATPGGGTATLTGGFTVDASPATSVENTLSAIPEEYVLQEAYPNPFNPSTRIRYGLPEQSRVKLEVYNMLGNVVAELVSGERSKGLYEVEWRAENLPSGVYLVRVFSESVETSKRFIASRKVVLVK